MGVGSGSQFKTFKPEKFKFSIVDEKTIKFGSSSSFQDFEMEITFMAEDLLNATSDYSKLSLDINNFGFTTSHYIFSSLHVANCDRF